MLTKDEILKLFKLIDNVENHVSGLPWLDYNEIIN